ncbi:MAG: dCMP deaminase family protein [Bacteroidota bacterium]
MSKLSFDQIYMNLAEGLAQRSHCIKRKVGAVITQKTRVIATGYNGPPEGTHNCDEEWPTRGCPRTVRGGGCSLALHAEQNAILFALKSKVDLQGSTLYITLSPCLPCARMIFSAGIIKVVYRDSYASFKGLDVEEGIVFLENLGVEVIRYIN